MAYVQFRGLKVISLLYSFLSQSLITLENIPTYTEVCVC